MNFKKRVNGSWTDTSHYIHNTSTDIITTLPAVIYPTGTTATVGLKGQTTQSSIPSPTSPVMPQGTGERTGNLVFVSVDNETHFSNYNQYTISDGTITVTGRMLIGFKVKITPDTTYTVSAVYRAGVLMRVRQYTEIPNDWVNGFINQPVNTNLASATFTTSSEAEWILVAFYSEVVGGTINSIMLNLGSTALPYEPFGIKIPILSNSTTTPVYLGEVETTRQIRKLVFDGTENWTYQSAYTRFVLNLENAMFLGIRLTPIISTHYITIDDGRSIDDIPNNAIYIGGSAGAAQLAIKTDLYTSATDFKAYLAAQYAAGTPVCVWYVLSTPTTGITNEPLMKIDTYADSLTTSVSCTAGENTLDVQTTVAPSEVTAGFSGWHAVSAAHERENGQWD